MRFAKDIFVYSPDEPTGGTPAAVPASTPSVTPAAPAQPEPTPAASPQASTSAGGAPAGVSPPAAPASWLESFNKEGFQEKDEAKARQQLLQSYRDAERLKPLAPALSAYQQHAQEFHKWLESQQKQPQTQADWTAQLGWNPPQWDNSWQQQLTTDAQGNIVPVPGAPADLVHKYQAYTQYRQTQAAKMLDNPGKYMEPYIRHIAQEVAAQHAQYNVGQYKDQQEANQFIEKHKDWLFEQDDKGAIKTTPVLNPSTGRYEEQRQLGQYGRLFLNALTDAANNGVPVNLQPTYAIQAVQNAYLASDAYRQSVLASAQPAPQGSAKDQANQKFTDRANPAQPPAQPSGNAKPAPVKVTRENLDKVMLERFRQEGITNI